MGTRVSYPVEIKLKAIEMKLQGFPVIQVMEELNIRNKSQLKTLMKWYREGQLYLLDQPVGKQYSFGKGPERCHDWHNRTEAGVDLHLQRGILRQLPCSSSIRPRLDSLFSPLQGIFLQCGRIHFMLRPGILLALSLIGTFVNVLLRTDFAIRKHSSYGGGLVLPSIGLSPTGLCMLLDTRPNKKNLRYKKTKATHL